MMKHVWIMCVAMLVSLGSVDVVVSGQQGKRCPASGKLKVFILAGQSNMVGFGQVKGGAGTMEGWLEKDPETYGHLVDENGEPVVRDDVWIVNLSHAGEEQTGWLTTGYGMNEEHIGPEYGFGFVVGAFYEDPVLLIKSAWGGRSLSHNFLSPSSEEYPEFKGTVAGVETRDFQRSAEESPSKQGFHWNRNWETLYLVGEGMGTAMLRLVCD